MSKIIIILLQWIVICVLGYNEFSMPIFFFFFWILGLVLNNSATELSRRIMRLNFGHWFACEWLDSEFLMSLCFAESPGFWTVLRCIARCLFTLFPVCVLLGASCCKTFKRPAAGVSRFSSWHLQRTIFFFFLWKLSTDNLLTEWYIY